MGEQTHLSRRIYLSTVRLNDVTTRKWNRKGHYYKSNTKPILIVEGNTMVLLIAVTNQGH